MLSKSYRAFRRLRTASAYSGGSTSPHAGDSRLGPKRRRPYARRHLHLIPMKTPDSQTRLPLEVHHRRPTDRPQLLPDLGTHWNLPAGSRTSGGDSLIHSSSPCFSVFSSYTRNVPKCNVTNTISQLWTFFFVVVVVNLVLS